MYLAFPNTIFKLCLCLCLSVSSFSLSRHFILKILRVLILFTFAYVSGVLNNLKLFEAIFCVILFYFNVVNSA